jgi:hypothetical protein
MNREDIIKLAREAGVNLKDDPEKASGVGNAIVSYYDLERFAALVAEHERNACAKVCLDMIDAEYQTGKVDHNEMAWTQACANAIRARRNT